LGRKNVRAILFDMDGVLFDSMKNHAEAWVRAMKENNLIMSREDVYMNEGRTGEGTIDIFAREQWGREATDEEKEYIYKVKSDIFNTLPHVEPIDGALELLQAVKGMGIERVIVTGSGQKSLLERLEKNFPGIFKAELMVTAFDVKHGKPHPEPYLMGLEKAGISAEEAVVVENAPLGVQAAKAAGIFTIAVNTGPLPDKVLYDAGADIVFPNHCALLEALPVLLV
jgi:HAD superfamily hydrolase (TIGR01509 family)